MASPIVAGLVIQETHDDKTEYHFSADLHRRAHHGFAVHRVPGQGRGVFATQDFAQGALLLSDPPLLSWPVDVPMTRQRAAEDLDHLVREMTVDNHAQMSSLMHHTGKHGVARTALGVWQSNALPSHASGGASLYADACRINHSCSPSLEQTFDTETRAQRLHVTHPDVSCGDQLSIAYDNEPGTRAQRRERLYCRFGFLCECRLCSLVGTELARSDERQARMSKLRAFIFDGAARVDEQGTAVPREPCTLISAVEEMLSLQRSEGLPVTWGQECLIFAMRQCQMQGDTPSASRFAWDAAEATRIGGGVSQPIYTQLLNIAARSHPSSQRVAGEDVADDGLEEARRVAWAAMLDHARAMVDVAFSSPAPTFSASATCVANPAATRIGVHILRNLLGASEIAQLHKAAAASVAVQHVWPRRRHTPAGAQAHDVRYSDQHVALFLHCDRYLETHWPRLYAAVVGGLQSLAHAQGQSCLSVRCIELHRYDADGGLFDTAHRDMGSTVTMSVQLSEPRDMIGGEMVTWSKGLPVKHPLDCGDAIVFDSEARHNVAKVVHGVRHSLVVELWRHPTNTHLNRYG